MGTVTVIRSRSEQSNCIAAARRQQFETEAQRRAKKLAELEEGLATYQGGTVLRLENAEGRGAYACGALLRLWGRKGHEPAPDSRAEFGDWWEELGPVEQAYYRFGWPDLDAAYRWFGREALVQMMSAGYRLVRIKVDTKVVVSKSKNQLVFYAPNAIYGRNTFPKEELAVSDLPPEPAPLLALVPRQ